MFPSKMHACLRLFNVRPSFTFGKNYINFSYQNNGLGFYRSLHISRTNGMKRTAVVVKSAIVISSSISSFLLCMLWRDNVYSKDQDLNLQGDDKSEICEKSYEPAILKSRDLLMRVKEEVGAPGLVIGVSIDGKTVWEEGFGYADVENRVKCTPNTVMRIASISKSITMSAVAKLWENGKLDLDKPIQEYVPDFPVKSYNGERVDITMRLLVSHLAGIRHYDKNLLKGSTKIDSKQTSSIKETKEKVESNCQKNNSSDSKNISEFELHEFYIKDNYSNVNSALELFKNDGLINKPGSKFLYSTHGWTLISAAVEKVAEESFTTHMNKLFKKLGMHHTYLDENDPIIYFRSRNYVRNKNGRIMNAPFVNNSYKWAGGGFLSTVQDLLKFGNNMLYSLQYECPQLPFSYKTIKKYDNTFKLNDSLDKEEFQSSDINMQNTESLSPVDNILCNTQKSQEKLPGYLTSKTAKMLWSPVTNVKDNESFYAMGWFVLPEKKDCEFCDVQAFSAYHSGGAVGASSILLILPKQHEVQSTLNCSWSSPPKGVVVTIICNLQETSLSKSAMQIAKFFDS